MSWFAIEFAASPEPETAANTQDTDITVKDLRKLNARHDAYCKGAKP